MVKYQNNKSGWEEKMKKRNLKVVSYIFLIFLILLIVSFVSLENLKKENTLYKTLLYVDSQTSAISIIESKADSYYDEAGFFYENENYKNVESSCRLARDYYSDASQEYREIKSELQQLKIKDKLIDIEKEMLGLLSEIELNMFEACEHFEVAVRYYDVYYNTNVPYDDSSYDMGTSEIDAMNEKIRDHDNNVREYNDLLADFRTELKSRF